MNELSGPVLLIVGPLLAGLVVLLLKRWPGAAALVGAVALFILRAMLAAIPLEAGTTAEFAGDTLVFYGRTLVLTESTQATFHFVYTGMAIIFLLSALFPLEFNFIPGSLALLSPLAAALIIQPFSFGIVLLLGAAALIALLVQGNRASATQAALRFFMLVLLAVPLFLVAGWMLEADQTTFMSAISQLLLVGFTILLAGFPFHIWVRPALAAAPPFVSTILFGLVQFVVIVFSLELLQSQAWLQQNALFLQLLRWSGLATVIAGGLLAYSARTFRSLFGYLLLVDMGAVVLSLTITGPAGVNTTLSLLVLRFASLMLISLGLMVVRHQTGTDGAGDEQLDGGNGLAWRAPLAVALLLYGGLSLAGLPLTPGFSGRWAVVSLLAEQSLWPALVLLLATASGTLGLLRCLVVLLAPAGKLDRQLVPEPPITRAVSGFTLAAAFVLAIFPQMLLAYAYRLAALF